MAQWIFFVLSLSALLISHHGVVDGKVKVVILAGQSNMFGSGSIEHLWELINNNATYEQTYSNGDGTLKTRSDVKIAFNNIPEKRSDLEIGYGLGNIKFGPEVGIGFTLGDYFDEPIFLIKVALGGTSLAEWWRPPSAIIAGEDYTKNTGAMYERMVRDVRKYTENIPLYFPEYSGTSPEDAYEIAAFCWLQGWADVIEDELLSEYEENLQLLVNDVQAEFGSDTSFLIGELGQGGDLSNYGWMAERDNILEMRDIQRRVASNMGINVRFIPTQQYTNEEVWRIKYDAFHHYWGRAETCVEIGNAFGRAVIEEYYRTPEPSVSVSPSFAPTVSVSPSFAPTVSPQPSELPSNTPTAVPSELPSGLPTLIPSVAPSQHPSGLPSRSPSITPTKIPSFMPSTQPSGEPSLTPTMLPSEQPSSLPSRSIPTLTPSGHPSDQPSLLPTMIPSIEPTLMPSQIPSLEPSNVPSKIPTLTPTGFPTPKPTRGKNWKSSESPTPKPSPIPSTLPSSQTPTGSQTSSMQPTEKPSEAPTIFPIEQTPSSGSQMPSMQPTEKPAETSTIFPGEQTPPLETLERRPVFIVARDVRGSSSLYTNTSVEWGATFFLEDHENGIQPVANITIYSANITSPENILQTMVIHTSCKRGFSGGGVFGALQVVPLPFVVGCPYNDSDDVKPKLILMRYIGGDCSQSSDTQQQENTFVCQDFLPREPIVPKDDKIVPKMKKIRGNHVKRDTDSYFFVVNWLGGQNN